MYVLIQFLVDNVPFDEHNLMFHIKTIAHELGLYVPIYPSQTPPPPPQLIKV